MLQIDYVVPAKPGDRRVKILGIIKYQLTYLACANGEQGLYS